MIGIFTKPNSKGQIVIPKEIRDQLGFGSDVTLNLTVLGKGIYIVPVEGFIAKGEAENSYVKLLEKTQGTWPKAEDDKKKAEVELKASKLRQKPW